MNLPYTRERLTGGLTIADVTLRSIDPLRKAEVLFDNDQFKVALEWDAILPMTDSIELTGGGGDDGFAKEMSHYHPEATCSVSGSSTLRDGERSPINAKGFRELSVGRSVESRVGKECVSTCQFRCTSYQYNNTKF